MLRILLLVLVLSGFAITASAQLDPHAQTEDKEVEKSYIYQWVDDKGIVHITDSLGKVPTRYHDKAVKLTQPGKEDVDQEQQVQQRPVYPSGAEPGGDTAAMKGVWQQRMRGAKQRLADAEKRYQELEKRRNELLHNWGADAFGRRTERIEAEKVEQQMKEVQDEIDETRNDIDVVIPDEARKQNIPPGWLRE
jgi:hypothetical protein